MIAGGGEHDVNIDGSGAAASFRGLVSMIITSDGRTIWCGACGVRRVRTDTGQARTCTDGPVFSFCWDRASNVQPDSAVYLTTTFNELQRFDLTLTAAKPKPTTVRCVQQNGLNVGVITTTPVISYSHRTSLTVERFTCTIPSQLRSSNRTIRL